MSRFGVIVGGLVLVIVASAAAATPRVPLPVQARIKQRAPHLAYVPTRMAVGFRYTKWKRTKQAVTIGFVDKAGWRIDFSATPQKGDCRAGMVKSYQLDGNKVYWAQAGPQQQAWRCVKGANGKRVRLVASSPQPPTKFAAVGLGSVVASGKRIP